MSVVLLSLGAAGLFGTGDFLGGLATRRNSPVAVVVRSQIIGLAVVLVALPLLPGRGPTAADLGWGALAGVAGGVGLVLLYRAMAVGAMSVVAPVAALTAAAVPIIAGLGLGDRVGATGFVGIVAALAAIALLTRTGPAERSASTSPMHGLALAAGAGFGLFYVLLDQTDADAGLWPLLGARGASITMLALVAAATRQSLRLAPGTAATAFSSGGLDMVANVCYLLAVRDGPVAVVAVLIGLYPACTVLMARAVLDEQLRAPQVIGLGCAGAAAVLIAL